MFRLFFSLFQIPAISMGCRNSAAPCKQGHKPQAFSPAKGMAPQGDNFSIPLTAGSSSLAAIT